MTKSQTDFKNIQFKVKHFPSKNNPHDNNNFTPRNNDQSTAINTDKGSFI
jgi:hypothetical protein